jgi:CheY-like chemotaxis protein
LKFLNSIVTNHQKNSNLIILLAEDDVDDQELLTEAFSDLDPNIQLVAFSSGKKFLQHLDQLSEPEIPGMIILDYNIPEINGAEILKHLESKKRYDAIIKLVWSTSNSSMYERSCLELGAKAYLVKPSNISGLAEMAKTMLSYLNK